MEHPVPEGFGEAHIVGQVETGGHEQGSAGLKEEGELDDVEDGLAHIEQAVAAHLGGCLEFGVEGHVVALQGRPDSGGEGHDAQTAYLDKHHNDDQPSG